VSDPPRRRESLLLAAVACEVKIKQTLREVCPPESRALLDYALDNPREVTLQAAGMYDKPAKSVAVRSVRDTDKALWKGIEALFKTATTLPIEGRKGRPSGSWHISSRPGWASR
jgi:hypothetical protein